MGNIRNLKKERENLGVFSIKGTGLLTEKAIFAALDALKASNSQRDEAAEWQHIKALQKRKRGVWKAISILWMNLSFQWIPMYRKKSQEVYNPGSFQDKAD